MSTCDQGTHEKVVKDQFSKIPGFRRAMAGDCFCLECGEPIPFWWNKGRPIPVDEHETKETT